MESSIYSISLDVLAILIPALVALVIALIKRKLGVENMLAIQSELAAKRELAIVAVKFAEQAYMEFKGPEKFKAAADWLVARAKKAGLKIEVNEAKGLIEWALREIKDQLGEQWAKAVN